MTTRRELIVMLGAGVLAAPCTSLAQQQSSKVARIGFLGAVAASDFTSRVEAMRSALRDLGWIDGKNLLIEYRWADGKYDRLPELAAELVRLKVDVLVTSGAPAVRAAKQATTTIPIVMSGTGDAIASGLVASLARPGGNLTGSTIFTPQIYAKLIELLSEISPRTRRVAFLINPDNPAVNKQNMQSMETTARSLKLEIQPFEVRDANEFAETFNAINKKRVDAVVVGADGIFIMNTKVVAELATRWRLPAIGGQTEFADAGFLMTYGVNRLDLFRRAAYFVDRILNGTKPADLPVERPTKFDLVVNMKTAKTLGITIPQSILIRVTKVIE